MPKTYRVGRSKEPLYHQLPKMAENLSNKLSVTCKIGIEVWYYQESKRLDTTFTISLVPGLNDKECTIFYYTSWTSLVDQYYFFLRGNI